MASKEVIDMVVGDVGALLDFEYEGVNIGGYTIKLQVKRTDGTNLLKTLNITDAANGIGNFSFGASDLQEGLQDAEIQVDDGSGTVETFGRGDLLLDVLLEIA